MKKYYYKTLHNIQFCSTLCTQFYIVTLRAERAKNVEIFLTLAPPPQSEKWIDAPATCSLWRIVVYVGCNKTKYKYQYLTLKNLLIFENMVLIHNKLRK